MTICSAVSIEYGNVTDRQTDRDTELLYQCRASATLTLDKKLTSFKLTVMATESYLQNSKYFIGTPHRTCSPIQRGHAANWGDESV